MNSTRSTSGSAAASCRSAATPSAVFQPWPIYLTPKSPASQAMRRCSLMPPTLVTSGCTMSKAPRASHGRKDLRRVGPGVARAAERPRADLEGGEAAHPVFGDDLAHAFRHLHEQRAIGLHTVVIGAAEQAADRLAGDLAKDVPERDVDAADHVRQ